MKILGIDSSGMVASVALVSDGILVGEYTLNYKKTHSQTLLPMLDEMMKMLGMDIGEVDAIAIAAGPGSFTGLRIGSATAKGLGLALDKPLVSVSSLEAMAYQCFGYHGVVVPMMDARRGQVYTGVYDCRLGEMTVVRDQTACDIKDLISYINDMGRDAMFLGDGVPVYKDKIEELICIDHLYAPAHMNRQRAASVASLGYEYYNQGKMESAADHEPVYLRLSQAERERLARENAEN